MRKGAQRGTIADRRAGGEWKGMFTCAIRVLTGDITLQTKFDLVQLSQILIEPILRFLISGSLQIVQRRLKVPLNDLLQLLVHLLQLKISDATEKSLARAIYPANGQSTGFDVHLSNLLFQVDDLLSRWAMSFTEERWSPLPVRLRHDCLLRFTLHLHANFALHFRLFSARRRRRVSPSLPLLTHCLRMSLMRWNCFV